MGVSLGLVTIGAPLRRGGGSFSPRDIPGLDLWLEADRGLWQDAARTIPAAADGDPVGAWDDLSGNDRHVTQPTASQRPTLRLAQVGGQPAVRFDGVDDFLESASYTRAQPITIACVVTGTNGRYLAGSNTGLRAGIGIGRLESYAGLTLAGGNADLATNWAIATSVFDGASSLIRRGGAVVASGNIGPNALQPSIWIGKSTQQELNGALVVLALYNRRLASDEIAKVERYLAQKVKMTLP